MRYTILFSIFLFSILNGCNKNKFGTTPTLKFEKVNTTNLHPGETIVFTLSFTYKGNLTGSLFVQELALNCDNTVDSINQPYPIPAFPASNQNKGEITVTYGYNTGSSPITPPHCPPKNDTAVFRFVLKDVANHASDTASSPPVVIYNK
ncbi:MAG: hypothetical protein M3Z26_12445 [Bacteroidota bacterium]|nr:hypothetical protein [Bacteroidota bacterium]